MDKEQIQVNLRCVPGLIECALGLDGITAKIAYLGACLGIGADWDVLGVVDALGQTLSLT